MPVQHRGKLGWHLGLDAECPECTGSAGPNPVPPRSQLDPLAARFGPRSAENPNAPDPQDLLRELHRAVYGDTWARGDSPADVWRELIGKVEAWRKAAYPKLTPEMPAWFEPFARGCAQGLEKGRNDALSEAADLGRFIHGKADDGSPVMIGHRLGCASIVEHLEMMRKNRLLHDDSCPACKWISDQLEEKAK